MPHRRTSARTARVALAVAGGGLAVLSLTACGGEQETDPSGAATTSAPATGDSEAGADATAQPAEPGAGDAEDVGTLEAPTETATASSAPVDEPTSTPATAVQEITVEIANGAVTPPPSRIEVQRGSTVRLTATSDVADSVHVHGFDETLELAPGEPGTVEFVADQTGLFEAETHETGLQLFQLIVRE